MKMLKKAAALALSLAMAVTLMPLFPVVSFADDTAEWDYPEAEAVALQVDGDVVTLTGTLKDQEESDFYKFTVPEGRSICLDLSSSGEGVDEVELTPQGWGGGGSPTTGTGVQIIREREGYTFRQTTLRTFFIDFGTSEKIYLNAGTYYVQVMAIGLIAEQSADKDGNTIYINGYSNGDNKAYLAYNYSVKLQASGVEDIAAGRQNGELFADAADVELNKANPCVLALSSGSPYGGADVGNMYDEYRLVLDHTAKINFVLSGYDSSVKYTEITIFEDTPYYASELLTNVVNWKAPDPELECVLSPGTYFVSVCLYPYEYIEQETFFGTPFVLTLTEEPNDAPVLEKISSSIEGAEFSWEAAPDAVSYNIYRRVVTEDNYYDIEKYEFLEGNVSGTSYTDISGELGQEYGYTVSAVLKDGTETSYEYTGLVGGKLFSDIREEQYYYEAVLWAVSKGITTGTSSSTFSPGVSCTRAQMVTFLWRAAGMPEPSVTENPFEDVSEKAYYYEAVLWAVEKNITKGMTATTFEPDSTLTRGQTATFLYRAQTDPKKPEIANPFKDVSSSAYYYEAVLWAYSNGVTNGVSADSFAPGSDCTRGQIVTFLWRSEGAPEI